MVYGAHTWSLTGPGPYLVLTISFWSQHGPYLLPKGSYYGPYVVPHGPYMVCMVPTKSLPSPDRPGPCLIPTLSLPSPYLIITGTYMIPT